jgi:hypothetical protein
VNYKEEGVSTVSDYTMSSDSLSPLSEMNEIYQSDSVSKKIK